MTSRNSNRISMLTVAKAALFALAIGGCATSGAGARSHTADLRGKAVIAGEGVQAIAQGPGRLLHVDVMGGNGLSLYSVLAKEDGTADCLSQARVGTSATLHRDSNELNLDLAPGQVVCVAVDASQKRRADIAWHMRQDAPAAVQGFGPETLIARR